MWDECNCAFFGIAFLRDRNENWPFLVLWLWHVECSTFRASSFRILNSSARILSFLLALFVVILLKSYLTSQLRMFGSRLVTTPSWLSGSLRLFLYNSVYSCHLFLISSASVGSLPCLFFITPILAWNVPLISPIFLKRSLLFPILLLSSISLHLRRLSYLSLLFFGTLHCVGYIFPFLLCLLPLFSSQPICKPFSDNYFAFFHLFFFVMVLVTASCAMCKTPSIVLWVLYKIQFLEFVTSSV